MKLDYCQKHRGAPVEDAALPCLAIRHDDGRRVTQRELWAEIERLRTENAALKHDLQYARDGLTKGRTRMREDNERLRAALRWIDGATAATPGLTDAELGRAMATIGKKARDALGA